MHQGKQKMTNMSGYSTHHISEKVFKF